MALTQKLVNFEEYCSGKLSPSIARKVEKISSMSSSRDIYLELINIPYTETSFEENAIYYAALLNPCSDSGILGICVFHNFTDEILRDSVPTLALCNSHITGEQLAIICHDLSHGRFKSLTKKEKLNLYGDIIEHVNANEMTLDVVTDILTKKSYSATVGNMLLTISNDDRTGESTLRTLVDYVSTNIAKGDCHSYQNVSFEETILKNVILNPHAVTSTLSMVHSVNKNHLQSTSIELLLSMQPNLAPGVINDLAYSDIASVKANVAKSSKISEGALEELAFDDNQEVILSVAGNRKTSDEIIDMLIFNGQSKDILSKIFERKNLSPTLQTKVFRYLFEVSA